MNLLITHCIPVTMQCTALSDLLVLRARFRLSMPANVGLFVSIQLKSKFLTSEDTVGSELANFLSLKRQSEFRNLFSLTR